MDVAFVALGCSDAGCAPPTGPVEPRQTLALARALAARGHRARVYLPEGAPGEDVVLAGEPPADGPQVHRLPALTGSPRDLADLLADGWSTDRPDLVQAAGVRSALVSVAAAESGRRERSGPIVADVRSVGELGLGADRRSSAEPPGQSKLAAALCRRADHVLSPSEWHASDLRRCGVAGSRLSVLPFGLPDGMAQEMAEFGGARQTRTLLCPDGPADGCGAADVLAALRFAPDAELIVSGGPDPERLDADRSVRRLRAIARELRVADRVRVVGALPPADQLALYRQVDMVVSVPRVPDAGLECIEAMSHGCCVVAGWTGGARDAVLPGITGMLVPPGDPRTLGRTLRELVAAPARVRSFGVAGADRARQRYGWGQLSTELERILGGVLNPA